jgi:hypothetical protein
MNSVSYLTRLRRGKFCSAGIQLALVSSYLNCNIRPVLYCYGKYRNVHSVLSFHNYAKFFAYFCSAGFILRGETTVYSAHTLVRCGRRFSSSLYLSLSSSDWQMQILKNLVALNVSRECSIISVLLRVYLV